jgi:uncharacterized protein
MRVSAPPARTRSIPLAQARRIALAAQGFGRPRPRSPGTRALGQVMNRLQAVQIDSVNVLSRAHYLPFFARLGPYDTVLLDRMRDGSGPRARSGLGLVEYWAHEASLIRPALWPYLGFRMQAARQRAWSRGVVDEHPGLLEAVVEVVRGHGPLTAREVEAHLPDGAGKGRAHWGWNWSAVKACLEYLFWAGLITSAGRTPQFERRYALPEHVLSPEVLDRGPGRPDAPDELESVTQLLRLAVRAHGIGSRRDLADYFRLRGPLVARALQELVAAGEVEQVSVQGWPRADPAYLDPAARRPRAVPGAALLSPFDSLVWQRDRVEDLWGFRYRIEIYVPAPQRVHGYYVLPFLLDEHLFGRVDLKADRAAGVLRVRSLHWETGTDVGHAGPALLAELESMAGWLGLSRVDLPTR